MHEASYWLSRLDRCFCRSFHDVKLHDADLRAVLKCHCQDLHGSPSEGSQQENREAIPCFADNPPVHDALQISTSTKAFLPCMATSISSLASLLQMCGDSGNITRGRRAHALLIEEGLERHQDVQNPLFQFYAKCRAMDDAKDRLARMHCLSVVSWNVMISSYLHEGCEDSAVQLFNRMQLQGLVPTKVTYICILSGCASDKMLFTCKRMHTHISTSQYQSSTALHTALFDMYGRYGSIEYARRTFNNIEDRDVIAWNAMILVYHEHKLYEECSALFVQMQVEGIFPNKVTLVTMLDICTHLDASFEGRRMHSYAINTGLISEIYVATAVITMCGKGRSLGEAVSLFKSTYERDTILWNAMIALYSFHGRCRDALQMLDRMLLEGFLATRVTFASILNVCASRAAIFAGKCIHACIVHSEMEMDFDVANALINMYGKFCSTGCALCTFQKMPERDVTTWSAMIAAFAEVGQCKNAFQAFHEMRERGVTPNEVTIVNVLRAFEAEADLDELRVIHDYVLSHGFNEDMMVGTALVSLYGKCGDLKGAQIVFDELPKHDILSWTALISSYVLNGQAREALLLFDRMKKEGVVPDRVAIACVLAACSEIGDPLELHAFIQFWRIELNEVVGIALLSMYGRFGRLFLSETLFNDLPKQQAATWNAMMVVYMQHGQFKKTLELFYQMCSNEVVPDKDSFVSSLTACANETSLYNGEKVHALIFNGDLALNDDVAAALVNMYGKCGRPDIAKNVFDQMQSHGLILWNAMVGVHAQHGDSMKVLKTMYDMCSQGCVPDTITAISVLNACSHTGLLNEGLYFVASMEHAHNISPAIDHYVCAIDMLGRSGRSREAEQLINCMPFQPKAVSYMSLLGACQSLANMHQGERAAKCMSELASENAGPYVSLSNIYVFQTNVAMGL